MSTPDKGNTVPEKRCATCLHWDRFSKRAVRGNCRGIPRGEQEEDGHVAQLVIRAADDTDLNCDLVTTGDFSCALHESNT